MWSEKTRKRHLDQYLRNNNDDDNKGKGEKNIAKKNNDTTTNTSTTTTATDNNTNDDNKMPLPFLPIRQLRLEAIFHPKFENEHQRERSIRQSIISKCHDHKQGYLEASVKHSGSLLLWSGGNQRYYSKNSTSNQFTFCGEILLRQHFIRAYYWNKNNDHNHTTTMNKADDDAFITNISEVMYQKCSDYIEKHRLTLSFEVVTTVLSDHGDKPKRDFLILTAVADRQRQIFFSTEQLIEFAQQFRLPHNDCWVFSHSTVHRFFDVYDGFRETGTTSTVVPALMEACGSVDNCFVQSMYPHADFQGEIMEGIVIRFVPCADVDQAMQKMARLAKESRKILTAVPVSLPDCHELVRKMPAAAVTAPPPPVLTTSLRQLHTDTQATFTKGGAITFENRLQAIIEENPLLGRIREVTRIPCATGDVPTWMNEILGSDAASLDEETRSIANLIRALSKLTDRVVYSVNAERVRDSNGVITARIICIVHVLHDQTFMKYQRARTNADMHLFRGFSFELIGGTNSDFSDKPQAMDVESTAKENSMQSDDQDTLMLKMKFLPYMIRTFGCRNGLKTIRNGGPSAFEACTQELLARWGISQVSKNKWQPFFRGWARYAVMAFSGKPPKEAHGLAPLSESYYLEHLSLFQKLYEEGMFSKDDGQGSERCELRGLVVVVAVKRETAEAVADHLANLLGGAERVSDMKQMGENAVSRACEEGQGVVCSVVVEDGFGIIRKLSKKFGDFISIILFECCETDVSAMLLPARKTKKVVGMLRGWRMTHCLEIYELPRSSLFVGDVLKSGDNISPERHGEFLEVLSSIRRHAAELPKAEDEKPGLLIFFPGIPGCGKSSCCSDGSVESMKESLVADDTQKDRNLIVQVGDKTKEKFWPLVKRMRLKDSSSILIADKNAPCGIWDTIGAICSSTKAMAVPVLPDPPALQTTQITGFRELNGSFIADTVHFYPFSLQYLAVCMSRVIERAADSHVGKLDQSTPRSCMIVTKFFALYRSVHAEDFFETISSRISSVGALVAPSPIKVPFFATECGEDSLPSELEELLVEALQFQYGCDRAKSDSTKDADDEYVDDLESRLRQCLSKYCDHLRALTEDESKTIQAFVTGVSEKVNEVNSLTSYEQPFGKELSQVIDLVSIDVDIISVHKILHKVQSDAGFSEFLRSISNGEKLDTVLVSDDSNHSVAERLRFVIKTHVTMAHKSRASQAELRQVYSPVEGSDVSLNAMGLLWSDNIMALAVLVAQETDDGKPVPPVQNTFAHITVWCQKGTQHHESNSLPELVKSGQAHQIDFEEPIPMKGKISFWGPNDIPKKS